MATKTYPQLAAQTTVQDSDLLASWRTVGPLKKVTAGVISDFVQGEVYDTLGADDGDGGDLITFNRDAASSTAMTLRNRLGYEVMAMEWVTSQALRDAITNQTINTGDAGQLAELSANVQSAFDEAPLGCDLLFAPGDWRGSATLTMRRQMNVIGAPGARIVAFFGASIKDLISVRLEEACSGAGDARRMLMQGFTAFFGSGGLSAVDIQNAAPLTANLHMRFMLLSLQAPDDGDGASLRFRGVTTQVHVVEHCDIDNQVWLDGCADSVAIKECQIFGVKPGVKVDVAAGAFKTLIEHNTITAQNGAILVLNASELDIVRNQIEQVGVNGSTPSAHIAITPQDYSCLGITVDGNNFGGGDNVDYSVYAESNGAFTTDLLSIGRANTWGKTGTAVDVLLNDSGVRWTDIDPNQRLRGSRSGSGWLPQLAVTDDGLGTMGVWNPASVLSLQNGWGASTDFAFRKTTEGTVEFRGSLTVGTVTPTTVIGTLPVGFRPTEVIATLGTSDQGGAALISIGTNGSMLVDAMPATGSFWPVSFVVPRQTAYAPGP